MVIHNNSTLIPFNNFQISIKYYYLKPSRDNFQIEHEHLTEGFVRQINSNYIHMKSLLTTIIVLFCLSMNSSARGMAPKSDINKKLAEYLSAKPEYARTKSEMTQFRAGKTPVVGIATHRAANEFAPENTLSAMECALDLEVDFIEIDVRQTRDGHSLLLHDGTLNRTTSGKGPIREMNSEQVRALSAGAWFDPFFEPEKVPTLEEACQLLSAHNKANRHQTFFYVDCKDINAGVLIDYLVKYNLLDGSVFYVNDPKTQINQLRTFAPKAKVMPGLGNRNDLDRMIETYHPYALDVNWKELSKELIDKAHSMGVKIFSDGFGGNQTVESYVTVIRQGIDVISTNKISVICDAVLQLQK
jgi:glycerophosphoryl diester phosphodiesterase